jgi:hypothetical protein
VLDDVLFVSLDVTTVGVRTADRTSRRANVSNGDVRGETIKALSSKSLR